MKHSRSTRIDLSHTFREYEPHQPRDPDWETFFPPESRHLTWAHLHEKALVVVIGQGGSGKSVEFRWEAERLREAGHRAVFVPLNLVVPGDWEKLIDPASLVDLEAWRTSTSNGFFFLDAIDECRLHEHIAFERAIALIAQALRGNWHRVRLVISSRERDWMDEEVPRVISDRLGSPLWAALALRQKDLDYGASRSADPADAEQAHKPFVVSLNPLSPASSRALAAALGLLEPDRFWKEVRDGGYEFTMTRPLDITRQVEAWNRSLVLGNLAEVLESSINCRLIEANPTRKTDAQSLSIEKARIGAERLAIAAVLEAKAYVCADECNPSTDIDAPQTLGWAPDEVTRLLQSALFDEAVYGRVQFYHRSVREYLAGMWLKRELDVGVPLTDVLALFHTEVHGISVLITSRRATLCWLGALEVRVREWLAVHFPEMLIYEGDPACWETATADLALERLCERLKTGIHVDWYNEPAELRRVAQRVSPELVSRLMETHHDVDGVLVKLMRIVALGELRSCEGDVLAVYDASSPESRLQRVALDVLSAIASEVTRQRFCSDLLAGHIQGNEDKAAALSVIRWSSLTINELVTVLCSFEPESSYGTGPLTRSFSEDLLDGSDAAQVEHLLEALLEACWTAPLPSWFHYGPEESDGTWLVQLLPSCVLYLMRQGLMASERTHCLRAFRLIEAHRHTRFSDSRELEAIREAVSKAPEVRWAIAADILREASRTEAIAHLASGQSMFGSFGHQDLLALQSLAVHETDVVLRQAWFELACDMIFRRQRGPTRRAALHALLSAPDRGPRERYIASVKSSWIAGRLRYREVMAKGRPARIRRATSAMEQMQRIRSSITALSDGAPQALHHLLDLSYRSGGRHDPTTPNFEHIRQEYGDEVCTAFEKGLVLAWERNAIPTPDRQPRHELPFSVIAAIAGLKLQLSRGVAVEALTPEKRTRAIQLAPWDHEKPPFWLQEMAEKDPACVAAELRPWVEADAAGDGELNRATAMVLWWKGSVPRELLKPLIPRALRIGTPDAEICDHLFDRLKESEVLLMSQVREYCRTRAAHDLLSQTPPASTGWLIPWMREDLVGAWTWCEEQLASATEPLPLLCTIARSIGEERWVPAVIRGPEIGALLQIRQRLERCESDLPADFPSESRDRIHNLRGIIPRILAHTRGFDAHCALQEIAARCAQPDEQRWIRELIHTHATLEAQPSLTDVKQLGTQFKVYAEPPRTERQLFDQVLARLQEVRKGLEEGPYSERTLFKANMPESHLQLWLASRLQDTPLRRFALAREEEVDNKKEPDIQVSCAIGKVCIEIKPLDSSRSYSAISLVEDTLKRQIVGQYLKGHNSRHGILVLIRLDDKGWAIPGRSAVGTFDDLVAYLQAQASQLAADESRVDRLYVLGMDAL